MKIRTQLNHLAGKRVVLMGLGLHGGGVATARWLLKHGANVLVTDLRPRSILQPSIRQLPRSSRLAFVLGRHREKDFSSADLIVANPGVPSTSPFLAVARRHAIPIVNEATIFFALCRGRVIGVTGTKGKSTTSTIIAAMLRKRFGKRVVLAGNIRTTPMLKALDSLTPASITVAELSSWHTEGLPAVQRSPDVAVVTNLLDDHLNRYPSRSAYFRAKAWIWRWQRKSDLIVLNADDAALRKLATSAEAKCAWFSLSANRSPHVAFVRSGSLWVRWAGKEQRVAAIEELRVTGDHMVSNMLAAAIVARRFGVSATAIGSVVRTFRGLAGRMEFVRQWRGKRFYNDTAATAPAAVEAMLRAFQRNVVVICGGMDKNMPFRSLGKTLAARARAVVVLPGTASEKIVAALKSSRIPIYRARTIKQAVRTAADAAEAGDAVVLSPGAASFNLFLHEFDRGDQFVRLVRRLP